MNLKLITVIYLWNGTVFFRMVHKAGEQGPSIVFFLHFLPLFRKICSFWFFALLLLSISNSILGGAKILSVSFFFCQQAPCSSNQCLGLLLAFSTVFCNFVAISLKHRFPLREGTCLPAAGWSTRPRSSGRRTRPAWLAPPLPHASRGPPWSRSTDACHKPNPSPKVGEAPSD